MGSPEGGDRQLVDEPPTVQERLDHRVPAAEIAEGLERVFRAANAEEPVAESVTVFSREPTVFGEPFDGVGVENLAPDVGVVPRVVSTGEGVGEVGARIAGRHGGIVEAD
jgi:hypothetical protein